MKIRTAVGTFSFDSFSIKRKLERKLERNVTWIFQPITTGIWQILHMGLMFTTELSSVWICVATYVLVLFLSFAKNVLVWEAFHTKLSSSCNTWENLTQDAELHELLVLAALSLRCLFDSSRTWQNCSPFDSVTQLMAESLSGFKLLRNLTEVLLRFMSLSLAIPVSHSRLTLTECWREGAGTVWGGELRSLV